MIILLLYKLDTLLLKQKKLLILNITGFLFSIRTHLYLIRVASFVSIVMFLKHMCTNLTLNEIFSLAIVGILTADVHTENLL